MSRRIIRLGAAATLAALVVGGCSEPTAPERPIPGELTIRWTTPNADDRAALLRVVVPAGMTTAVPEVATPGLEVFHRRTADTLRIAVFGDLASGALVRVAVPDVRQASRVGAQVTEVSGADDAVRASLAGYAVTVERP